MVVAREDFLSTCKWVLGHINQTHKGFDGRFLFIESENKIWEITWAISKIAVLPVENC